MAGHGRTIGCISLILLEEFLVPFNITPYRLAKDIEIPQTRVSEIIKGNRRIRADTALRLSKYFGNSAKFWLVYKTILTSRKKYNKRVNA